MARAKKKNYLQRARARFEAKRIEAKARLYVDRVEEDSKGTNNLYVEDDTESESEGYSIDHHGSKIKIGEIAKGIAFGIDKTNLERSSQEQELIECQK